MQALVYINIHGRHHLADRLITGFEAGNNLRLAPTPVGDIGAHKILWVINAGAMGWPVNFIIAAQQQIQRRHIGIHIAIGRGNHRG